MRLTTLKLADIEAAAASKGRAWRDEVFAAGTVRGLRLEISVFAWNAICLRHGQFGDAFATVAQPLAEALGLDPNCGGCNKRGQALNGGSPLIKKTK